MNIFNLSDPNFLPWLIPVGPLLAFLIITLATNRSHLVPANSDEYGGHHPDYEGMKVPVVTSASRVLSIVVGLIGILLAWVISLSVVGQAFSTPEFGVGTNVFASQITWMDIGTSVFNMSVLVDPLTTIMLFMVPLACTMIFVYSIGYMANDPRQARFFSLIALFAGAMLTLVVAGNLLMLFIGWEVMGLCSYMLIGFWFEKHSAYRAAIKAFTVTRVADVIMLLGIVYLYTATGTLNFRDILYNPAVLESLNATPAIICGSWGASAATIISIFLIIGTVGKSAQFPLHVWLPDAMEGPTPVSAMIHAAAMVSAGIYAVIRMYPLFSVGADPEHGLLSPPLLFMAIVGSVTALFAATIAVSQNDVKKVLAYSTISQLGFMMASLGIGAYIAAAFHLMTHAFFKALLFLASGAVIHGMEHGEHHVHAHAHGGHGALPHSTLPVQDTGPTNRPPTAHEVADSHAIDAHTYAPEGESHEEVDTSVQHGPTALAPHTAFDPQDMMNMGGLRKTMPVTFVTFLIGGLSLAGFPLITAGFWSKDEILAAAFAGIGHGYLGAYLLVFICLFLAAILTAFYTTRQIGLTFWGEPRTEEARHANLGRSIVSVTMTAPLIVLAFFAITTGFVGVPSDFPILGPIFSLDHNPFHHFVGAALLEEPASHPFNLIPVLFGSGAAIVGIVIGWLLYWRKPLKAGEVDPMVRILGPVYPVLQNKYYIDELYTTLFVRLTQWFASAVVSEFIDKGIIDGFLHLVARVFTWIGDLIKVLNLWLIDGFGDGIAELIAAFGIWFRRIQTGNVQQYILLAAVAVLIIGLIFAVSTGLLAAPIP